MTFNNSILAGLTLVREAIESEGFVSGSTGWRIDRDGDAEFNGVTIRADLQSDNFVDDVSGWNLERIGNAEFNDVTVRGVFEAKGINPGAVRIANASIFNALPRPSIELIPSALALHGPGAGNNDFAVVSINAGEVAITNGLAGDGIVLGANHFLHHGNTDTEPYTLETWNNITVNSGVGFAGNGPQVKLLPDGTCLCRGGISGHSTVGGTTIATLPVGYRPLRNGRWVCATESTADQNHVGIVAATGAISIAKAGANNSWFTQLVFSTI